jgi:hypothetical protein
MPFFRLGPARGLPPAAVLCGVFLAGGCGGPGVTTHPVRGKITVAGAPLKAKSTVILFKPDAAKGNTSPFEPAGTVNAAGRYVVSTQGKKGAPLGWYKVVVTATGPPRPTKEDVRRHHPMPVSLVAAKYGQVQTTDLAVEVVAHPAEGAYDLKLTR